MFDIKNLPWPNPPKKVTPKSITYGYWIPNFDNWYYVSHKNNTTMAFNCSRCKSLAIMRTTTPDYKFCPYCGIPMKEGPS